MLLVSGCRKDDEFKYFDLYTGDWQFRIYRKSWGYPWYSTWYDTIHYSGSIKRRDNNRGIEINCSTDLTLSVWVENGTIYKDGRTLGSINNDSLLFDYSLGTTSSGAKYSVYGLKKAEEEGAVMEPKAVTKPASGITIAGSGLRGLVNAG